MPRSVCVYESCSRIGSMTTEPSLPNTVKRRWKYDRQSNKEKQANTMLATARAGNSDLVAGVFMFTPYSRGLTSRAQARGTNQREPRSGTGLSCIALATREAAIPRCLQRFVRRRCHPKLVASAQKTLHGHTRHMPVNIIQ